MGAASLQWRYHLLLQYHAPIRRPRRRRRRPRHLLRHVAGVLSLLVGITALSLVTAGVIELKGRAPDTVFNVAAPPLAAAGPPAAAVTAALRAATATAGGRAGISVIDLGGRRSLDVDGGALFTAASTYKLPLLMAAAERMAAGSWKPADQVCFTPNEGEDGWFDDYRDGDCYSRQELALRTGRYSDNTAAHMLVDGLGGAGDLNAYARSRGAADAEFYAPNLTDARDLAALMTAEAQGRAGGPAAQRWLYPLLTNTSSESGIPAGVGAGATVVHKIGDIDDTVNDVGLVSSPRGSYVVAITTDHVGGDAGWALVAALSRIVWSYETA